MNFLHNGNFVKQKQKGSPTKFLGFVKQQIFIENRDVPFVGIKLFDTRSFLKHRRVPLRNDSVLPDKTILTENRDTRPLSSLSFFDIRNFLKNRRVPLRNFLAL